MAVIDQAISLPTSRQAITEEGQSVAQPWYRFFQALANRSAATVPYTVGTGLVAAGSSQADALVLNREWNEVTTTALNTGVPPLNSRQTSDHASWADIDQSS